MSEGNAAYYKMMVLLETNAEVQMDENSNEAEESSMKVSHEFVDELELDIKVGESYLDELNTWFDDFDEKISIPNEGFLKYEITNDGLIILLVNEKKEGIVDDIKKYVQEKCSE